MFVALGLGLPQVTRDGKWPPQNLCLHSCPSQDFPESL